MIVSPLAGFLYERWWRVAASGAARVPAEGGVLLVANHADALPWSALMVARAVPRETRFLLSERAFALPWVSLAARRAGAVPDAPANAERLLREGLAVVMFPEVGRAPRRHEVARFGDEAFVDVALRTEVPVVPVGVVGGDPLPSRWRIAFGSPLDLRALGAEDASDRAAVLRAAEAVREQVQSMVRECLVHREGAFL